MINSSRATIMLGALVILMLHALHADAQYYLSVAASPDGNVFVADKDLPGIWSVKDGAFTKYFAGSKKFRTPLNAVRCIEFDGDGRLLVGDSATRDIYRFDEDGQPVPLTRVSDDPPYGQIGTPMDIAVNSKGDIYVSDLEVQRIVKVPKAGGKPEEVAEVSGCRGLFVDGEDRVWVVSTTADQLLRIAPDGSQEVIVKGRPFGFPHTVVVDAKGTAYVCDGYAKTIWKVAEGAEPTPLASGEPFINPIGLTFLGDDLLVADSRAAAVHRVAPDGAVTSFATRPAAD